MVSWLLEWNCKSFELLLLDDCSGTVRRNAVSFLGGIMDGEVEGVMAVRIKSLALVEKKDPDLMFRYVKAVTTQPVNEERVVSVMLLLLDRLTENGLRGYVMQRSRQCKVANKPALEFYERYWWVLTKTGHAGLSGNLTGKSSRSSRGIPDQNDFKGP